MATSSLIRYQKFVVGLLATLQFLVIIDLMLMAPLGVMIMPALHMSARELGLAVSAYAFSAGFSSLLVAGYADRFDRKKLLLLFYTGFILGTLWCGLSASFSELLLARVVTGLFAGVIGSIVLAIAADLFASELRGRVMSVILTASSASQVLGLPAGLYLANHWGWHAPFLLLATLGAMGGLVILFAMRPMVGHLAAQQERRALHHLYSTLLTKRHWPAFAAIAFLTTGGYMLMPFSSAFMVNNLGVNVGSLSFIYLFTGLCTIIANPFIGSASDTFGRLTVFYVGCTLTIFTVVGYTHLSSLALPGIVLINVLLFLGIFSRLIPFQAMAASVPKASHRGAFNAVLSAVQQLSGGCASLLAGHIVSIGVDGKLQHYDQIGYLLVGTTTIAGYLVWKVYGIVTERPADSLLDGRQIEIARRC